MPTAQPQQRRASHRRCRWGNGFRGGDLLEARHESLFETFGDLAPSISALALLCGIVRRLFVAKSLFSKKLPKDLREIPAQVPTS
jgi:hypothetical protein